jgi:hypothetical protein
MRQENAMIGLLVMKPLLLLGGVGYLGYRVLYKPMKAYWDADKGGKSPLRRGIDMKPCPKCGMYIRSDAGECPSCHIDMDDPSSPG